MKYKFPVQQKSIQGFSLPEVLIAVLILAIVTTISLLGISRAQSSFQLTNGAETLKVYVEKAFSDAKRRDAKGDVRSKIQVTSPTTYRVTIDFDGDGVPESRNVTLSGRVTFVYDSANPPTATIDGRGNVAEGKVLFNFKSNLNQTLQLELSDYGDSNIYAEFPSLPTVTTTPTSSDVSNSMVLAGNSAPNLNPSPTPTPTPLPECTSNQKPALDDCRCKPGKHIKDDGKCS
jgi:prepilin-type N-terminal cleavage/methylation domain-containing protein